MAAADILAVLPRLGAQSAGCRSRAVGARGVVPDGAGRSRPRPVRSSSFLVRAPACSRVRCLVAARQAAGSDADRMRLRIHPAAAKAASSGRGCCDGMQLGCAGSAGVRRRAGRRRHLRILGLLTMPPEKVTVILDGAFSYLRPGGAVLPDHLWPGTVPSRMRSSIGSAGLASELHRANLPQPASGVRVPDQPPSSSRPRPGRHGHLEHDQDVPAFRPGGTGPSCHRREVHPAAAVLRCCRCCSA